MMVTRDVTRNWSFQNWGPDSGVHVFNSNPQPTYKALRTNSHLPGARRTPSPSFYFDCCLPTPSFRSAGFEGFRAVRMSDSSKNQWQAMFTGLPLNKP